MPSQTTHVPPLIAARGLSFARNDACVFGPLDFAVDAGEALLVQGDNGSGKPPCCARAGRVAARRFRRDRDRRRACARSRAVAPIAYLGHLPALKADLTALENLHFLCGLHGRRRAQCRKRR